MLKIGKMSCCNKKSKFSQIVSIRFIWIVTEKWEKVPAGVTGAFWGPKVKTFKVLKNLLIRFFQNSMWWQICHLLEYLWLFLSNPLWAILGAKFTCFIFLVSWLFYVIVLVLQPGVLLISTCFHKIFAWLNLPLRYFTEMHQFSQQLSPLFVFVMCEDY